MSLAISNAASPSSNCNFDIFLSHSGQQKLFVHSLYQELQRVNYGVFFDQDYELSLPKGSKLVQTILNTIKHSKMGVVVISKDFITTLWPMLELQHLMDNSGCIIYPVFYEIQPGDLVNKENLKKWKKCWKALAKKKHNQGYPVKISTWPESLERLKLIVGTTTPIDTLHQTLYEKLSEIVKHICHVLPPPMFYYNHFIKGKESTQQDIQEHYKHVLKENLDAKVLVLGVAGIAGSGKTTLCKTMVDYYNLHEFPGNCAIVELPTDEVDKEQLISKFKTALQRITWTQNISIESITDIDQMNYLFKQAKKEYFLGIDNVSDWNILVVEQILEILLANNTNIGETANTKPKVIITSRSKALLKRTSVGNVVNVPRLKEEEALDILLSYGRSWGLYKSNQILYENDIRNILNICSMNYGFHPLLLKTLGNIMSQIVDKDGNCWKPCIDALKSTCLCLMNHQGETTTSVQCQIEESIFNALYVNYNHLPRNLKKIFLDITILYPGSVKLQNISMLRGYQHIGNIELEVLKLEYCGLWNVCRGHNNQIEGIDIHDLYRVLAKKEAKESGRFLVFSQGEAVIAPSSLSKVTYVVNLKGQRSINPSNLKGLDFSELVLDRVVLVDLHAHDLKIVYDAWSCASIQKSTTSLFQFWFSNVNNLIRKWNVLPYKPWNIESFHSLSILKLDCGDSVTRLDGVGCALNLRSLILTHCYSLKHIKGVGKLKRLQELILSVKDESDVFTQSQYRDNGYRTNSILNMVDLGGCSELMTLAMLGFDSLKRLGDLHCPHSLQRLILSENRNLVDVDDISNFGNNLQEINITNCDRLKEFRVVALPKLEKLNAFGCLELEVIMDGGILCDENFPCLKSFEFHFCPVKILPRIAKTSGLKSLVAQGIRKKRCIFNLFESTLGPDLETLHIEVRREQFMLLNYSQTAAVFGSKNLRKLRINIVTSYREIICTQCVVDNCTCNNNRNKQEATSTTCESNYTAPRPSLSLILSELQLLQELELLGFDFIKSSEELSCLTELKFLKCFELWRCSSIEGLPALQNLRKLILVDCRSLKTLPHNVLSGEYLEELRISGCPALENFQDSIKSCKYLTRLRMLMLDYDSCVCSIVVDGPSKSLDLSNIKHIDGRDGGGLTIEGFPASSLSNIKWPKRVDLLGLSKCSMQDNDSQLDLSNLTNLERLGIVECTPSICCWTKHTKWPPALNYIYLANVFDTEELHPCLNLDITDLSRLKNMYILHCDTVQSLAGVSFPTSLEKLWIGECESLEEMPNLSRLVNLRRLSLGWCKSLKESTDISNLVNLRHIRLYDCPSLEQLKGYRRIRSGLKNLRAFNCPSLKIASFY